MKLINFNIFPDSYAHSIVGLGNEWDLHNLGHFRDVVYDISTTSISLNWTIDYGASPWEPPNGFVNENQLSIIFYKPSFVLLFPRRNNLEQNEDDCLAGISKVTPIETNSFVLAKYRIKAELENESYNLWFVFQSGWSFEIGAESAELSVRGVP